MQFGTTKHDFTTLANNIAYLLQEENIIKKYYIFIQFKIKNIKFYYIITI